MKLLHFDSLGGISSAACFAHCLMVSMAPALLANIDWISSNNEIFEWAFFGFALLFALVSAGFGFKNHKNTMVLGGFALGIFALSLGRASEALSLFEGGDALSIFGGLTLFLSHLQSIKCCKIHDNAECLASK